MSSPKRTYAGLSAVGLLCTIWFAVEGAWVGVFYFVLLTATWLYNAHTADRERAWGFVEGRREALTLALDLQRQGVEHPIETVINIDAALFTGHAKVCGECKFIVPAKQVVTEYHGPNCSRHPNQVPDAQ